MLYCANLSLNSLNFEGDCLNVVNWSNSHIEPPSDIRSIIFYIRNLLQHHSDWTVTFTCWESNKVGRILAKMACTVNSDCIWIEDYPGLVMSSILLDMLCNHLHQWSLSSVSIKKYATNILDIHLLCCQRSLQVSFTAIKALIKIKKEVT